MLDLSTSEHTGMVIHQMRGSSSKAETFVSMSEIEQPVEGRTLAVGTAEGVTRHVRQAIWVAPESRRGRSVSSYDMSLRMTHCDRGEVVRRRV